MATNADVVSEMKERSAACAKQQKLQLNTWNAVSEKTTQMRECWIEQYEQRLSCERELLTQIKNLNAMNNKIDKEIRKAELLEIHAKELARDTISICEHLIENDNKIVALRKDFERLRVIVLQLETEMRAAQLVQHAVMERYCVRPDIIHGGMAISVLHYENEFGIDSTI